MPIKNVYDHIVQQKFKESAEPVIREKMTEYAETLKAQNTERTFWFDISRSSVEQKVVATPISNGILIGLHKHDYYEFNVVLKGTLYEYIEDRFFSVSSHEMIVFHPDVFHSVYPAPGCVGYNILVDKAYFEQMKDDFCADFPSSLLKAVVEQKHYVLLNADRSHEICRLTETLDAMRKKSALEKKLLDCRFRELLLLLLLAEDDDTLSVIGSGSTSYEDKIVQMTNYIRDNYNTVTLGDISRKFGYSPAQIHRLLLKYAGSSFSDLVDQYRFNHAARLLKETDIPIEKIGSIIGLEKTYFFRFFKRLGYCTPLQYRKISRVADEKDTEVDKLLIQGYGKQVQPPKKSTRA